MPPPGTAVAVVIVTYNRADVLVGCLDGLAAQTSPPDAVYVVDNASADHTPEVLAARTDLPLRIIRSEENLGGAGGFHLGVGHGVRRGLRPDLADGRRRGRRPGRAFRCCWTTQARR